MLCCVFLYCRLLCSTTDVLLSQVLKWRPDACSSGFALFCGKTGLWCQYLDGKDGSWRFGERQQHCFGTGLLSLFFFVLHDACIHHLKGSSEGNAYDGVWLFVGKVKEMEEVTLEIIKFSDKLRHHSLALQELSNEYLPKAEVCDFLPFWDFLSNFRIWFWNRFVLIFQVFTVFWNVCISLMLWCWMWGFWVEEDMWRAQIFRNCWRTECSSWRQHRHLLMHRTISFSSSSRRLSGMCITQVNLCLARSKMNWWCWLHSGGFAIMSAPSVGSLS